MQKKTSQNAIYLVVAKLKSVFQVDTDTKLSEHLGVNQNTISTWKTRGTIDYGLIISKCDNKNIDLNWLFDNNDAEIIFHSKSAENLTKVNSKVKSKEDGKERNAQKTLPSEPQMPSVIVVDTSDFDLVPIVDVSAAAGGGGAYNPDYIDEEDVMRLPPGMLKRGYHLCIRVKGISMEPTIQDGSHVIVRLLDRSEWVNVKSGEVYVVTNRMDGATFIKRLQNRLRESGCLICTSDNPDKGAYRDFEVPEDDISNIWHVEYCISSKLPNVLVEYESQMDQMDSRFTDVESKLDQVSRNLDAMRKMLTISNRSL